MILDSIIQFFISITNGIIDLLPQLPQTPQDLLVDVNTILDLIFSYSGLINFFIPLDLCVILLSIVVVTEVVKHTWAIIDFTARHIPVVGTH